MGMREKLSTAFAAARGDSAARYLFAERIARAIHPDAILSDVHRSWMRDDDFESDYRRFHRSSFRRTMDRVFFLDQLAGLASELPGETAECGVFEGLSSYMICRRTQPGKRHYAFDSFAGLSAGGTVDGEHWAPGDMSATEATFRKHLADFDVEIHAGWIPDRFPMVADVEFSLVHIDVDLYEPTLASIEFFYPRMTAQGVMVFDDYGFVNCPGARAAVDEYFADCHECVLHAPTGQGVVIRGLPA